MARALSMASVSEARQLIDSIEFESPLPHKVQIEESGVMKLKGAWFLPDNALGDRTVMFFHGGGYAFFARAHLGMIGQIACAAKARTFALDYRLTPEHPHPAQLDDAYAAYRALLAEGYDAQRLILAGDSAGGHLVLSLLNSLRQSGDVMPALAVCLCPWTELGPVSTTLFDNDRYDWVQGAETLQFARWLQGDKSPELNAISPMSFDLKGFPPLYVQAGGREVLYDMIVRFARRAADADEEITLDVWREMTHDFQAYGVILQESKQALARISEAVEHYLVKLRGQPMSASPNTLIQCHGKTCGNPVCRAPPIESDKHPEVTSQLNRLSQLY
jgi:acetyl esterase/lipase